MASRTFLGLAACLLIVGCRRVEDDGRGRPVRATRATIDDPAVAVAPNPAPATGTTVVVPDFARVAAGLEPSVVSVIATVPREEGRRNKVVRGLGSGMLVSSDGEVLTNEHVVASASRVDVELSTGERIPAIVKVTEPLLDLALLELDRDLSGLSPVEFSSEDPKPGQWVMAVGQPFGLGNTVTVGVVSGSGRDHDDLGRPEALDPDGLWNFIQTDASINIGNSGGPLVNADGHVVGITTAVRNDGQGLAFAVPARMAKKFLSEARTYGRVRKARLGIRADNATGPDAGGLGSVVRVTKVDADGPGARADLQPGDFILQIGGDPVHRVSDVAYLTQLHGAGIRITFTIRRGDGSPSEVEVVPDEAR